MLAPVPMVSARLLVFDRDLDELSRRLGYLAVLHPVDVGDLGRWADSLTWTEMNRLADRYSAVQRRLDRAMGFLRMDGGEAPGEVLVSPDEILHRAEDLLDRIEPEIRSLENKIHALHAKRVRFQGIEQVLSLLTGLDVDISILRSLRFLYQSIGLAPYENLKRLDESLKDLPHVLLPVRRVDSRVLILSFCKPEDAQVLDRALRSAYVERLEIPSEMTGTPNQGLSQLRLQLVGLDIESEGIERELGRLRARWGRELQATVELAKINAQVVDLWKKAGRTDRVRLLAGWVPKDQNLRFATAVEESTASRAVLLVGDVPPPEGNGDLKIPTALKNPAIFRPFEAVTKTYGMPSYWDVDPTPFAAGLFVLLFGAMFGDLGEGFVLLLLGLLLANGLIVKSQRDFGRILAACSVSAMVFGVLYGEVFGSETVIPALWFRPLQEPLRLIAIAIGLGVVVISIGLILGIVTAWRRKDRASFFFGQHGIAGLWLYWGLLVAVLIAALAPGMLTVWAIIPLVVVPALLILLHGPIARSLGWLRVADGGSYAIQAGIETFDLVIRFASNTISFMRVGAFALGHIGLGITVFAIAELVSNIPGSYLLVVALGNLLIIALESLIVGIQALRLEYYELFTKFLSGGGIAYRPFALEGLSAEPRLNERES